MKTRTRVLFLLLMIIIGTWMAPKPASAQGATIGFQFFYDELSPYGTWIDSPQYGYVWVPDVAPGFTPYSTNGYWVFTSEGWTWVSNYSWGWAPFHYGRWYMDPMYGAMWVPDNEWGPGWVTWRRSGDYYGWAPIGPGVTIDIAYGNNYYVPNNQWTFVRDRDFGRTNINQYYVNNSNNVTIINNSTVISNTRVDRSRSVTYNAGPERADVEKHAGRSFTPVVIIESTKPGQHMEKNQLQIYRPQVQNNTRTGIQPVPSKVVRLENVKTTEQRKAESPSQKTAKPTMQQPVQQQQNQKQNEQRKPPQEQKTDPPAKQQPQQQQHQTQPPKQQPQEQQHQAQPAKQQPPQQQHQAQPPKQQPQEQQHQSQPPKQQPPQQQHQAQPPKQQPQEQQHQAQPAKQQPPQQQHQAQPPKQQPQEQQHQAQPAKQQSPQQQHQAQPPKQQPSQPEQTRPGKDNNKEKGQGPPKDTPPK